MAITIRNQRLEAEIRKIGLHTGEGPSAVIARAIENLNRNGRSFSPEESKEKYQRLMRKAPPRDPNLSWKDIEEEMDSIF
jgi:hypothetical protein